MQIMETLICNPTEKSEPCLALRQTFLYLEIIFSTRLSSVYVLFNSNMFKSYVSSVIAMVVLLNHINLPEVTIAVDGSLFEHHPTFRLHMETLIAKWRRETKVG